MKITEWHERKMATDPEYAAAVNALDRFATDPQSFRVSRDGERDLTFLGWKLGQASVETGERRYEVTIYATIGGKYVTHAHRIRDGHISDDVTIAKDAADLLTKLQFGRATVLAWNEACAADPQLAALETESIE